MVLRPPFITGFRSVVDRTDFQSHRYFTTDTENHWYDRQVIWFLSITWGLLGRNPPLPPKRWRNNRSWQTFVADDPPADQSVRLPLIGVTYVWNEGDIIAATVKNLRSQGAAEVFVLDDGSSDDTAQQAESAGATVISGFRSDDFSEERRTEEINRFIASLRSTKYPDAWYIVVDADEFPRGPDGLRLVDFIAQLPEELDIVGARVIEHIPIEDSFEIGQHPAASLPNARLYYDPYCDQGHWKHPLVHIRPLREIRYGGGRHLVYMVDGSRAREAISRSILIHHLPIRKWDVTEARLTTAGRSGSRYDLSPTVYTRQRPAFRIQTIRDLRHGRSQITANEFAGQGKRGLSLRPWRELASPSEGSLPDIWST